MSSEGFKIGQQCKDCRFWVRDNTRTIDGMGRCKRFQETKMMYQIDFCGEFQARDDRWSRGLEVMAKQEFNRKAQFLNRGAR